MDFLGARIQINPRPNQSEQIALDVGVLGHCPGRVRIERLLALTGMLDDMREAGFSTRVDDILEGKETNLYHLPIPLHSSAEFDDVFPDAHTTSTLYSSLLAGDKAWLPQWVEDFFANGGKRLWVVRVPESEAIQGFFPGYSSPLDDAQNLHGIVSLLVISNLGLIALPDMERLQIPAQLPDVPSKRLSNPAPQFLPLTSPLDDGPREQRYGNEPPDRPEPLPLLTLLRELLSYTAAHRPDVQFLYSLPLAYSSSLAAPAIDSDTLSALTEARNIPDAYLLRQVQLLFPYLRSATVELRSPSGVIAGAIAASAQTRGIWRSIGGRTLFSMAQPYPALDMQQTIALREMPGIGILSQRVGQLTLDDERLMVPALQRNDYYPGPYSDRLNGLRSAEVVRFLGYLVRQLKALGEQLVFNVDPEDPRPQILLEQFFRNLYRAGALRGKVAEEAFSVRRDSAAEGVIAFDIQIAPAYPIDKIVATFVNIDGEWAAGVING